MAPFGDRRPRPSKGEGGTMATNIIRICIRNIRDWLAVADYEAAKDRATTNIIKRFGRGNVSFQNGKRLNRKTLSKLSARGDRAAEYLEKHS